MMIDTSLDTLMLPALPTYQNEFGTKRLNGGLTTAECTDGVMIWGRRQRPFPVTETSETTKVEAHCTFEVTTAGIELTIADATFAGCEAKVINAADGTITVKGGVSGLNGSSGAVTIPPRAMLFLTFFEGWITSNSTYSGNNEVSDFEKRIFLAAHPVTTLYWTSDPRNPGDIYGGTWKQIKDRFILAAGDTYSNGEAGGNANTTLTAENLPSHSHSFTPKGNIESHAHYFTPKGNIASTAGGSDNQTSTPNTSTVSINDPGHTHAIGSSGGGDSGSYPKGYYSTNTTTKTAFAKTSITATHSHTHTAYFTGDRATTEETESKFTGTEDTTSATGSGTAFSNMPPYEGKYCWERVA